MLLNVILTGLLLIGNVSSLLVPVSRIPNKNKPHKVEILNKNLVVWWDPINKKWSSTDDMCLHRQASLSKGVITKNGDIKCGYHGLEYNSCGTCVHMPSSERLLKYKLDSYTIIEKSGLLWLTDNDEKDIDVVGDFLKTMHKTNWYFLEVDCPADLLFENSFDSLHFSHVHHKLIPQIDRYNPLPIMTEKNCKVSYFNESGFSFSLPKADFTFLPPYTVKFTVSDIFNVCAFVIPISETRSRFVSNLFIPCKNKLQKYTADNIVFLLTPVMNILSHKIFSQDLNQIMEQKKYTMKYGKQYMNSYKADQPIFFYNKWMREYGNTTIVDNNILLR